jgi:hypothetical protein
MFWDEAFEDEFAGGFGPLRRYCAAYAGYRHSIAHGRRMSAAVPLKVGAKPA